MFLAAAFWAGLLVGDEDPKPLSFYRASPDQILAPLQDPPRRETLDELRTRADRLTKQAAAARAAGDEASHRRLTAEASWLMGDVKDAEGRFPEGDAYRREAVKLGYQPPVHPGHPAPEAYVPHLTPPMIPVEQPYIPTLWDFFNMAPYPSMRNNSFYSLVGMPPMDQAATLPWSEWALRVSLDYSSSNYSRASQGGTSVFNGTLMEENVTFDYGVTDFWQAGFRGTTGLLSASSASRIVVFEDAHQIIRRGTRGFFAESLTLRNKFHWDAVSFAEFGVLSEFKIPLDRKADLLTANTFDTSTTFLLSRRWGPFAAHLNVGGVFPIGHADDIFRANDVLDPSFVWGLAGTVVITDRFTLGLQAEGNTSPFGQISVLSEAPMDVLGFGRVEIYPAMYLDFSLGAGVTRLSSDFNGSVGFTWSY